VSATEHWRAAALMNKFSPFQGRNPDTLQRRREKLREWRSLLEHLVEDQGVGGSNRLSPTKYSKYSQ
jgi:hypothetical protein